MAKDFAEKRMEVLVVFQEKLALRMNDSDFRHDVLEPIIFSGVTDESLNNLANHVLEEEELQGIVKDLLKDGYSEAELKKELKILLKKLIERFSKFNSEDSSEDYIG